MSFIHFAHWSVITRFPFQERRSRYAYLLFRSGLRLLMLSMTSVELFLVINFATGVPLTAMLMSWSVWYGVRSFRRSEEWGPVITALEVAGVDVTAVLTGKDQPAVVTPPPST